jgi:hypothetical protein
MPFLKPVTDPSGVISTYWAITNAHADFANQTVMVAIAGWLDAASYANKHEPSARRSQYFQLPFSILPSVLAHGTISMDELYAAVATMLADPKKESVLSGATIVA